MDQTERRNLLWSLFNVSEEKKETVFFLGFCILAFFLLAALRSYYAFSFGPQILNQDEAAILMNARFLAEAGKDEWAASWPLVFRSFGDAKLPGYMYTTLLFGKVLDFSPFAVRLPSLLAGLALPFVLAAFSYSLFRSYKAGLLTALFVVLSPWSWHYGSLGFEAHFALVFFVAALALLFSEKAKKSWYWDVLAGFFLLIAGMTYNTPTLLLPFVLVSVFWQRRQDMKSVLRVGAIGSSIFLFVIGITLAATAQKAAISVFQDPSILALYPEYRMGWGSAILQKTVGNIWVYFSWLIAQRWFASFDWQFLVLQGGANPWHGIPSVGHLHPFVTAFSFMGLALWMRILFLSKVRTSASIALFLLLSSLAPAVITVDAPHATRSLFFFVMLTLSAGQMAVVSYEWMCQRWNSWWWKSIFVLALLWGFSWWWSPAGVRWDVLVSPRWNTGLVEVLQDGKVKNADKVAIVDPDGTLYTLVAVYQKIPVHEFLQSVQRSAPDTVGMVRVEQLGKYRFIFQAQDVLPGEVLLQPKGNTQWDIIGE